jgi:hypothetical protein
LLKHLGDAVTNVLGRHRRQLRQLEALPSSENPVALVPVVVEPSPAFQARSARFAQVRAWRDDGLTINAIARLADLDRKTVRTYLNTNQCPDGHKPHRRRSSKLEPYQAYLLEHADGQRTVRQLWRDIQAQGFTGGLAIVATFLAKAHSPDGVPAVDTPVSPVPSPSSPKLTPRRATWLLLAPSDELTPDQRQQTERLIHLHPDIEYIASHAQSFAQRIRQHQTDALDPWLNRTRQSVVRELRTFARGIQRDYEAVKAALAFQSSNGPVEGQVNRLKFIKRQMFGRAKFDLLRIRVLCRPSPQIQQKRT